MPCPAPFSRSACQRGAAILVASLIALSAASPAFANAGEPVNNGPPATSAPAEFPALSKEPALAQRQALGCSVVGLGLTGLALASGAMAGGGGAAAGPAVGQLLAYFGAGCTMGAFIATAFPMGDATPDTSPPTPASERSANFQRLRMEAVDYIQ